MKVKTILLGASLAVALAAPASASHPGWEQFDSHLVPTFVGWGGYDLFSGHGLETTGIAFSNALHEGYVALSDSRNGAWDKVDAEHFNQKARTAARRSDVLPDDPLDRHLDELDTKVFTSALHRMLMAFDKGGREEAPKDSAEAQVAYDCWIEAVEYQRDADAQECRSAFESALARVEKVADYKLTEVGFAARPMMAAVPPQPESYLVHFEFDSTTLTPIGQATLDEAIQAALDSQSLDIVLVGHADRSGAESYNQALSERRAQAVISAMSQAGIGSSRVSWSALGETSPLVPTPDGVKEQGNRVVEIDLK